nr:hypothetical protein [Tanacetum cinerariifolium]
MSNINNNMQTQTSNSLHNAIMKAGSKDRLPMLAPGNYIQWKSRIKRYIDTKPNRELIHYCLKNPLYELGWKDKFIIDAEGNPTTATHQVFKTYQNVEQEIRNQLNAEAEAVQIILTGIDNDIYSTVDACPNACEMWKAIERLKQGESINVQDLETNLFWEFRKFTSLDGESLKSYYSRFYKLMNELTRNKCRVINHQVNVQFLLQLQPECQRTHQSATRKREKSVVNSPQPIYDQEPSMVDDDEDTSKDKEIDKLMALISLSFKKIYKPTNNNLRTSSNTSRANQDNSLRIHRNAGYEGQRSGTVAGARKTVERSRSSHTFVNNENLKESFNKQTIVLEKRMDESIPLDKKCQSSIENFKVKTYVNTIINGVELCKEKIANRTYSGYIDPFNQNTIEAKFSPVISRINAGLEQFYREYYYVDHVNAILGMYTELDEVTNLQCDYLELLKKCEGLETELSKRMYKVHTESNQTRTSQLPQDSRKTNKRVSFSTGVIPTTSVSRPRRNNSQGKDLEVEDQRRSVKFSKNKTSVTACNDSLNAKTLNVNSVCVTCDTCVLNDKHDICVLHSVAKPIKKSVASESNQKPRNITRKLYERI